MTSQAPQTRTVIRRDSSMVVVLDHGEDEPESIEVPAWAVKAIIARSAREAAALPAAPAGRHGAVTFTDPPSEDPPTGSVPADPPDEAAYLREAVAEAQAQTIARLRRQLYLSLEAGESPDHILADFDEVRRSILDAAAYAEAEESKP